MKDFGFSWTMRLMLETKKMMSNAMDYEKVYFEDAYIVSGHTPTDLIDKAFSGRIIQKKQTYSYRLRSILGKAFRMHLP